MSAWPSLILRRGSVSQAFTALVSQLSSVCTSGTGASIAATTSSRRSHPRRPRHRPRGDGCGAGGVIKLDRCSDDFDRLEAPHIDAARLIQRQRSSLIGVLQRYTRHEEAPDEAVELPGVLLHDALISNVEAQLRWLELARLHRRDSDRERSGGES